MFSWVENGWAGWADISPAVRRRTTSRTARIGQALALFGWDKKRWTGWAGRVTHVWLVLGSRTAGLPAQRFLSQPNKSLDAQLLIANCARGD